MTQSPGFEIYVLVLILIAVLAVLIYSFRVRQRQKEKDPYLEALENILDGRERLAIQKFKEAIRSNTENVAAYIRLGDLLRKRGMVDQAARIHQDLTHRATLTREEKIRIYQSLVEDFYQLKNYSKGILYANQLIELEKKPGLSVVQRLLEMYEKSQDWERAFEAAKKFFSKSDPKQRERMSLYLVFRGLELEKEQQSKNARIKFKEALKLNNNCSAAYYYLGKSYEGEERLEDAIEAWSRLCKEIPDKAYLVFPELEKAWFELGRFTDAENLYLNLFQDKPRNTEAGIALVKIYTRKGEFDRALEILNELEEDTDDLEVVLANKILIYYEKGQYKVAATEAKNYFENLYPNLTKIYQCTVCGLETKEPLWLCPNCQSISSFGV